MAKVQEQEPTAAQRLTAAREGLQRLLTDQAAATAQQREGEHDGL